MPTSMNTHPGHVSPVPLSTNEALAVEVTAVKQPLASAATCDNKKSPSLEEGQLRSTGAAGDDSAAILDKAKTAECAALEEIATKQSNTTATVDCDGKETSSSKAKQPCNGHEPSTGNNSSVIPDKDKDKRRGQPTRKNWNKGYWNEMLMAAVKEYKSHEHEHNYSIEAFAIKKKIPQAVFRRRVKLKEDESLIVHRESLESKIDTQRKSKRIKAHPYKLIGAFSSVDDNRTAYPPLSFWTSKWKGGRNNSHTVTRYHCIIPRTMEQSREPLTSPSGDPVRPLVTNDDAAAAVWMDERRPGGTDNDAAAAAAMTTMTPLRTPIGEEPSLPAGASTALQLSPELVKLDENR